MKERAPDISGMPITKLPAGKAYGAGDLQRWASNRAVGRSGADSGPSRSFTIQCASCGGRTSLLGSRFMKWHNGRKRQCRHCGGKHPAGELGRHPDLEELRELLAHCAAKREHRCCGKITIDRNHITFNCPLCGDARKIL